MTTQAQYTPREASEYLAQLGVILKPSTLAKMRVLGNGPKFRKDGGRGVRYGSGDLDDYAETRLTPAAASTAAHDEYRRRQNAQAAA